MPGYKLYVEEGLGEPRTLEPSVLYSTPLFHHYFLKFKKVSYIFVLCHSFEWLFL